MDSFWSARRTYRQHRAHDTPSSRLPRLIAVTPLFERVIALATAHYPLQTGSWMGDADSERNVGDRNEPTRRDATRRDETRRNVSRADPARYGDAPGRSIRD
jgi:hypothetical protein